MVINTQAKFNYKDDSDDENSQFTKYNLAMSKN